MGGYLISSLDYLQTEGLVPRDCVPYQEERETCTYRCQDSSVELYEKYYCKVGSLAILTTYTEMKRELYENGPMMMGLIIYEDFMNYDEGIYKYVTGDVIGGHAMKLVGYGEDEEEGLYWIL